MASLFAHLVSKFATHPENLATEALAFVLSESEVASGALVQFAARAAPGIQRPTAWRTQMSGDGDDESTPDLVGTDQNDVPLIIVEAKFWAGLTENQPGSYLKKLPGGRPATVIVVAPAVRLVTLWNELVQRAGDDFTTSDVVLHGPEYRSVRLAGNHALGLCSWRLLLANIAEALSTSGDVPSGADLAQLSAMCELMDTTAFLPLRSDELTGAIGTRVVQYIGLVSSVADELKAAGIASSRSPDGRNLGTSYGMYWSGTYLNVSGWTCILRFSSQAWARSGATPIWLQVGYHGDPPVSKVVLALNPLASQPGRVVPDVAQGFVDVAIHLPTGVERHSVVADMVRQVERVRDLIAAQENGADIPAIPDIQPTGIGNSLGSSDDS